ncbi:MAG: PAS domain S-box protein [bacterium]|nr:PAS domain S-box protein [bacterium]
MSTVALQAGWRERERARLFDEMPSGVMVVDDSLSVVDSNRAFSRIFGDTQGRACYEVIKGRDSVCSKCPALATFEDGQPRVIEETGADQSGRAVHFLAHVTPVANDEGDTEFVASIVTDLSPTRRLKHEYQTLFETVPCFVAVINRDHRVVRANEAFRRVFGEPTGERCYRLYKRRRDQCPNCPVDLTFEEGSTQTSHQMGVSQDGRPTPYLVVTAPLRQDDGEITHVIEMALDMTEHQKLEERLSHADVLRLALVESSLDAIVVFDHQQKVVLANPAAEKLIDLSREELIGGRAPNRLVPKKLRSVLSGRQSSLELPETHITTAEGERIPVRMAAVTLEVHGKFIGSAVIAQDLRELKTLAREKLEAERLAAVGQTVAGLAHGIKNIITGLEGGMYVTSTGLKRGDQERIGQGWGMLVRNMSRISELTKNLLAFSRGETPRFEIASPAAVAHEVVDLYQESAAAQGIKLIAEIDESVAEALIDPEGIHSCLANLVSNAVDACLVCDGEKCTITLRLFEADETIVFEVSDSGCGMDYEVMQKAFTSFFTTKAKGGTGLGLLLTRKIVQQHGGYIDLESESEVGTTFRMRFERARLPVPDTKENTDD